MTEWQKAVSAKKKADTALLLKKIVFFLFSPLAILPKSTHKLVFFFTAQQMGRYLFFFQNTHAYTLLITGD